MLTKVAIAPPKGELELDNYIRWFSKRQIPYRVLCSDANLEKDEILFLCGGADIGDNKERDELEFNWIHKALEQKNPIIGTCKGLQIVNVALEGTLIQDIKTDIEHKHTWDPTTGKKVSSFHTVSFNSEHPNSHIELLTNSRHHQAVDKLGKSLKVEARSEDDIIEVVSGPNIRLVQWHPELEDIYNMEAEKYVSNWIKLKLGSK